MTGNAKTAAWLRLLKTIGLFSLGFEWKRAWRFTEYLVYRDDWRLP
jgi:hypothetical protein